MADTITCPKCGTHIEVTDVLSSQLREKLRKEFDAEAQRKEQDFAGREQTLREQKAALEASQKSLDSQIEARITKEREALLLCAQEKATRTVLAQAELLCRIGALKIHQRYRGSPATV